MQVATPTHKACTEYPTAPAARGLYVQHNDAMSLASRAAGGGRRASFARFVLLGGGIQ